jgi:hypothetical protein
MPNYTLAGPIVRGSRWPAGDLAKPIILTRDDPWEEAAADWSWQLLFSRTQRGGTPDLAVRADSVTVAGKVLTILFHLTPKQTASLSRRGKTVHVELQSDDGQPDGAGVSTWDEVAGTAQVRDRAGEA